MKTVAVQLFLLGAMMFHASAYDPGESEEEKVKVVRDGFLYQTAKGESRHVPVKFFFPEPQLGPAPVVLFSHGLGGSVEGSAYLGTHLAGRGYVMVAMQHAGSDDQVWRDRTVPVAQRMKMLKEAANAENTVLRREDVSAVLDQLEKWNGGGGKYAGCFDLGAVGMSGHSYGAVTTQGVSGQAISGTRGQAGQDNRIRAAILYSPSPPTFGSAERAFGQVKVPWFVMTGTKDHSPIGRVEVEDRRKVFAALPATGNHYELVLFDGEHMAFSDRTLLGGKQRDPSHHERIQALSAAFWDCYLCEDQEARSWLKGEGSKALLGKGDVFQSK